MMLLQRWGTDPCLTEIEAAPLKSIELCKSIPAEDLTPRAKCRVPQVSIDKLHMERMRHAHTSPTFHVDPAATRDTPSNSLWVAMFYVEYIVVRKQNWIAFSHLEPDSSLWADPWNHVPLSRTSVPGNLFEMRVKNRFTPSLDEPHVCI